MIKISATHRAEIRNLLTAYSDSKYESVFRAIAPILQTYHTLEPQRLGKRLLSRLFGSWSNKEEEAVVVYWMCCKLIADYGYPAEYLDIEVDCGDIGRKALEKKDSTHRADIVAYSNEARRAGTAIVTIECRKLNGVDGSKQAASYSRALQSRFHLFTDSNVWKAFETQPHPIDGTPIGDIPYWVGYKPLAQRMPKEHILPPITDEQQLRDLIRVCHDQIHSEGVDLVKVFDELVKLFFVKVYDE